MGETIQVRRGPQSRLPELANGEMALTIDTKDVYIGTPEGNELIGGQTITSQLADIAINVKSNGVDDTTTIQNAINNAADGSKLLLSDAEYIVSSDIIVNKNLSIIGSYGHTKIKIKNGSRIRHIFKVENIKSIIFNGIIFDMNVQNTVAYQLSEYADGSYNQAIYCKGITDIIDIRNCQFINLYNEAVSLYQTSATITRISDNIFTSPAQSQSARLTHINLQTIPSGSIIIENNVFDNAQPTSPQYGVNAIFAEGVKTQTIIRKNKMNWCGRDNTGTHRLLAIDLYGNCNFFTISDNIFDNCIWGYVRLEASQDCTVERNKFYQTSGVDLTDSAIWINGTTVYTQAGKNVRIKDNEFYANSTSRIITLVTIWTLDWSKTVTNIEVTGNSVFGNVDNFVRLSAGIDTVKIENNRAFPYDGKTPRKLVRITRVVSEEPIGAETSGVVKGVVIRNNHWESAEGAINIDLTTYTGVSEQIIIEQNKLKGASGMGSGIVARNVPITIRNNFLSHNPEGAYIIGSKKAYIFNNILETMDGSAFALGEATNVTQAGNYYNGVLVP